MTWTDGSLIKSKRLSEEDSGLVELVVMTNVFFNTQQHEIKVKWFIYVKQIGLVVVSSVTTEISVSVHSTCKT